MTLEDLSEEEAQRMSELYVQWCQEHGELPDPRYFTVWLEENY